MKRELTATPPPSSAPSSSPPASIEPSTPSKKAKRSPVKVEPKTPKSPKSKSASAPKTKAAASSTKPEPLSHADIDVSQPGWTAHKREAILNKLIVGGLELCKLSDLAAEFNLDTQQVSNATRTGRKGNLRDKACRAVRGDE